MVIKKIEVGLVCSAICTVPSNSDTLRNLIHNGTLSGSPL